MYSLKLSNSLDRDKKNNKNKHFKNFNYINAEKNSRKEKHTLSKELFLIYTKNAMSSF